MRVNVIRGSKRKSRSAIEGERERESAVSNQSSNIIQKYTFSSTALLRCQLVVAVFFFFFSLIEALFIYFISLLYGKSLLLLFLYSLYCSLLICSVTRLSVQTQCPAEHLSLAVGWRCVCDLFVFELLLKKAQQQQLQLSDCTTLRLWSFSVEQPTAKTLSNKSQEWCHFLLVMFLC